jgi:hypothetical protein
VNHPAVLAYVFWHWPPLDGDIAAYEEDLTRFHHAFHAGDPPGFITSAAFRVTCLPWAARSGYEDWYVVDDFAALGRLNEAAIASARQGPHRSLARGTGGGIGGLYRLHLSAFSVRAASATWLSKPRETEYERFDRVVAQIAPDGSVIWRRQMVLGPAPEYCILSEAIPIVPPELGQSLTIAREAVF